MAASMTKMAVLRMLCTLSTTLAHVRCFCSSGVSSPRHSFLSTASMSHSHAHRLLQHRRARPRVPVRMSGGGAEAGETVRECSTSFGLMKYRVIGHVANKIDDSPSKQQLVLFLHGLGSSSLTCQPPQSLLASNTFLVPDFFAHGVSSLPVDPQAYSMESLAKCVLEALQQEKARDVFVIAHSMGGPVAVELCERGQSENLHIRGLIYEEGNLDEGDCFGSKKLAQRGSPVVDASSSQELLRRFGQCECAKDLVRVSVEGELLPRILQLKAKGIPVWFAYGEKNRGRFTSEALLVNSKQQIEFIANGGHSMHADGGQASFWRFVAEVLASERASH